MRMRLWHCVGDAYAWLETWPQVSGVQRVALQLMAAGCGPEAALPRDGVAVLSPSERWLAPVETGAALAAFAPWIGGTAAAERKVYRPPWIDTLLWPEPREHVLFAGLVWNSALRPPIPTPERLGRRLFRAAARHHTAAAPRSC